MVFKERISLIRSLMQGKGIDALILPHTDPHLSSNVPSFWRIIEWVSGFTGSAGTLVITAGFAGLWTDSRYFVQAERQLSGSGVSLMDTSGAEIGGWLAENLEPGSRIGVDGNLFSIKSLRRLEQRTVEKNILVDTDCDLISGIWTDRPVLPDHKAFDLPVIFAGRDRKFKIRDVRSKMEQDGIDYQLLTAPDDIMWLLNIRGRDLEFSPLLLSFALVGKEQILLFADENKIPFKLAAIFDKLNIVILPYEEVYSLVAAVEKGSVILISPATISANLYRSIPEGVIIREDITIPAILKTIKNNTEIDNTAKAMIRDGVALTRFFYTIGQDIGRIPVTECSAAALLNNIRSRQENFLSLSFSSIVAFNEHAAMPHYKPSEESDSEIVADGILLVDSGSHYLDGTTDITRTVSTGKPTQTQKRDFTLVLKGMISLAEAVFPAGTFGYQLDILARKSLWEDGLNYGHGTGHGVGYCLNVHEGPVSISPLAGDMRRQLMPGMILSDEPAVYRQGKYGIRTENLLLCFENEETEFGRFLGFNTLSLCYIDKALIDITLLDKKEIKWLDNYHAEVYDKLNSYLDPEEEEWLREKTSPLICPV